MGKLYLYRVEIEISFITPQHHYCSREPGQRTDIQTAVCSGAPSSATLRRNASQFSPPTVLIFATFLRGVVATTSEQFVVSFHFPDSDRPPTLRGAPKASRMSRVISV